MFEDNFAKTMEQASAFQKIWMESISKTMQAAFTISPTAQPPEMLLHMRQGIFKALAESWEQFMRSPQFLDGMQQWMEHTITFRKMTKDMLGKVHNEMQSPSRDDIDAIMVSVRHLEKRMLDRVEDLSEQVRELKIQLEAAQRAASPAPPQPAAAKRRAQPLTVKAPRKKKSAA